MIGVGIQERIRCLAGKWGAAGGSGKGEPAFSCARDEGDSSSATTSAASSTISVCQVPVNKLTKGPAIFSELNLLAQEKSSPAPYADIPLPDLNLRLRYYRRQATGELPITRPINSVYQTGSSTCVGIRAARPALGSRATTSATTTSTTAESERTVEKTLESFPAPPEPPADRPDTADRPNTTSSSKSSDSLDSLCGADEDTTLQRKLRVVYLASMQITSEDVQSFILPNLDLTSSSGSDSDSEDFGRVLQKAKSLQAKLQRDMWGTKELRKLVFHAVKSYDNHKTEPPRPPFQDLPQDERNRVLGKYFTTGIARRILAPVKEVVDVEEYLRLEQARKFLKTMFLTACNAIYDTSDYSKAGEGDLPRADVTQLYVKIRTAAKTYGAERLRVGEIPLN